MIAIISAASVGVRFGDTVLHGALRQDVLMRLELRQEDNIVSGQSFLSHNQWSLFSEEEDKFWFYHAISIPGRNAPILFRHTDRPGIIEPEVQIFDYRTAGWQAFPMVRQYYATEAFQNSAAAAGFLHELMPHLSSAISDLPMTELRPSDRVGTPLTNGPKDHKPHGLPSKPSENASYRRCVRVLAMVHELHKAGYQRLRILPMLSPSGCYWRGVITFADNVAQDGYHILRDEDDLVARYTSGQDNEYFGWKDAAQASARELAMLFLKRFPEISEKGEGLDWAYAGWLTDVLGYAELGEEKGGLIHLIQDWENEPNYMARWTPPPPNR